MTVGYILNTITISIENFYILGFPTDIFHFYAMFEYLLVGSFLMAFIIEPIDEKCKYKKKSFLKIINVVIVGVFMYFLFYNIYDAGKLLSTIIGVGSALYIEKDYFL
ncbi:hypothetical protein [uncultured Methanolobus sp.]|uniref:hypothetical protein n=1 Tax=uncultured Methanolobus sp. TaxID=218300 RepID=UPI002AAAE4C5|nr:hypothetical protein [uncultured Methanolobus sp.]